MYKGVISKVFSGSIAEEMGLEPGDSLTLVNGQPIQDIIDLSFALADEYVELQILKLNGEEELLEIEKDETEELGIEFESAVFDKIRRCGNKCVFCFVDQMAPGLRETLYVKDDDYRLSFLYGNFITLTNITDRDLARIKRLHLSPLYVSIHTTNGNLRAEMLNSKRAGEISTQLKELIESGIELHTQIVLCPGLNDEAELERTISDLYHLAPGILSVAIVPVGLTKYRENCSPLSGFTPEGSKKVIEQVEKWQHLCRSQTGKSFVYLSDEFYLAAGKEIPAYDMYDGFPQLENGIGLVRDFLTEWEDKVVHYAGYNEPIYIDVICGISAAKVFNRLFKEFTVPNLNIRIVPVSNRFFGEAITVTGLLTGQDILHSLNNLTGNRSGIIIPGIALRKGEDKFLDNMTIEDIQRQFSVPVRVAYNAGEMKSLLTNWLAKEGELYE